MAFRPQLFSGARGILKINGVAIAYVTDVTVNVTNNVRAVHTFGAPNARSVEPLSSTCSVTIGRVIPVNDPQGSAINTSAVNTNIEPVIAAMTSADDIQVQLLDKVTGATVANVQSCRFTGRTLNVASQQIATERITLVGIYDAAGGNALGDSPIGL